jgi:hypothetical protein
MPTDKAIDLFVKLQSAVDASQGLLTWSDLALGIERLLERKRQESVASLLSSMTAVELHVAKQVAHREMGFSAKPERTVEVVTLNDKQQQPSSSKRQKRRA